MGDRLKRPRVPTAFYQPEVRITSRADAVWHARQRAPNPLPPSPPDQRRIHRRVHNPVVVPNNAGAHHQYLSVGTDEEESDIRLAMAVEVVIDDLATEDAVAIFSVPSSPAIAAAVALPSVASPVLADGALFELANEFIPQEQDSSGNGGTNAVDIEVSNIDDNNIVVASPPLPFSAPSPVVVPGVDVTHPFITPAPVVFIPDDPNPAPLPLPAPLIDLVPAINRVPFSQVAKDEVISTWDIDKVRAELMVARIGELWPTEIVLGGIVKHLRGSPDLSTAPYLLVSSNPVLFAHCGDNSLDDVRTRLVKEFSDTSGFYVQPAQNAHTLGDHVDTLAYSTRRVSTSAFIRVLLACGISQVTYYTYNQKSKLMDIHKSLISKLRTCIVPNTQIELDIGQEFVHLTADNKPCFTFFSLDYGVVPEGRIPSGLYDADFTYPDRSQDIDGGVAATEKKWQSRAHATFPLLGDVRHGGIALDILPTQTNLHRCVGLSPVDTVHTKVYSCITHYMKSMKTHHDRTMRMITKAQAINDIEYLRTKWQNEVRENLVRIFGVDRASKLLSAYRVEFTVKYSVDMLTGDDFGRIQFIATCLNYTLHHLANPITIHHIPYDTYVAQCQTALTRANTLAYTLENGTKYLSLLDSIRVAYVRSVFGISDAFTCMNLKTLCQRQIPLQFLGRETEFIWTLASANSVLSERQLDWQQERNIISDNVYTLSLVRDSKNDMRHYELCQRLHEILVYRWQHGHAKSAKMYVTLNTKKDGFWAHSKKQRMIATISPVQLLVECATLYLQHRLADDFDFGDFFNLAIPKNPITVVNPKPTILWE